MSKTLQPRLVEGQEEDGGCSSSGGVHGGAVETAIGAEIYGPMLWVVGKTSTGNGGSDYQQSTELCVSQKRTAGCWNGLGRDSTNY